MSNNLKNMAEKAGMIYVGPRENGSPYDGAVIITNRVVNPATPGGHATHYRTTGHEFGQPRPDWKTIINWYKPE